LSDGVTQEARPAVDWKWRSKPVGGPGRQIRWDINPERPWDAKSSDDADRSMPSCQEKLLASQSGTRTKTDTGGMVEYTKARERNPVKELGNLAP
jgi:hypothetical protein